MSEISIGLKESGFEDRERRTAGVGAGELRKAPGAPIATGMRDLSGLPLGSLVNPTLEPDLGKLAQAVNEDVVGPSIGDHNSSEPFGDSVTQ